MPRRILSFLPGGGFVVGGSTLSKQLFVANEQINKLEREIPTSAQEKDTLQSLREVEDINQKRTQLDNLKRERIQILAKRRDELKARVNMPNYPMSIAYVEELLQDQRWKKLTNKQEWSLNNPENLVINKDFPLYTKVDQNLQKLKEVLEMQRDDLRERFTALEQKELDNKTAESLRTQIPTLKKQLQQEIQELEGTPQQRPRANSLPDRLSTESSQNRSISSSQSSANSAYESDDERSTTSVPSSRRGSAASIASNISQTNEEYGYASTSSSETSSINSQSLQSRPRSAEDRPQPITETDKKQQAIQKHIDARFVLLNELASQDKKIVIASLNPANGHELGIGLAVAQWEKLDGGKAAHERNQQYLTDKITALKELYPNQVSYGDIEPSQENKDAIRVWGANVNNWNLEDGQKIKGGGQANAIGARNKNTFGIVTTPKELTDENLHKLYEIDNCYQELDQKCNKKSQEDKLTYIVQNLVHNPPSLSFSERLKSRAINATLRPLAPFAESWGIRSEIYDDARANVRKTKSKAAFSFLEQKPWSEVKGPWEGFKFIVKGIVRTVGNIAVMPFRLAGSIIELAIIAVFSPFIIIGVSIQELYRYEKKDNPERDLNTLPFNQKKQVIKLTLERLHQSNSNLSNETNQELTTLLTDFDQKSPSQIRESLSKVQRLELHAADSHDHEKSFTRTPFSTTGKSTMYKQHRNAFKTLKALGDSLQGVKDVAQTPRTSESQAQTKQKTIETPQHTQTASMATQPESATKQHASRSTPNTPSRNTPRVNYSKSDDGKWPTEPRIPATKLPQSLPKSAVRRTPSTVGSTTSSTSEIRTAQWISDHATISGSDIHSDLPKLAEDDIAAAQQKRKNLREEPDKKSKSTMPHLDLTSVSNVQPTTTKTKDPGIWGRLFGRSQAATRQPQTQGFDNPNYSGAVPNNYQELVKRDLGNPSVSNVQTSQQLRESQGSNVRPATTPKTQAALEGGEGILLTAAKKLWNALPSNPLHREKPEDKISLLSDTDDELSKLGDDSMPNFDGARSETNFSRYYEQLPGDSSVNNVQTSQQLKRSQSESDLPTQTLPSPWLDPNSKLTPEDQSTADQLTATSGEFANLAKNLVNQQQSKDSQSEEQDLFGMTPFNTEIYSESDSVKIPAQLNPNSEKRRGSASSIDSGISVSSTGSGEVTPPSTNKKQPSDKSLISFD